MKSILDSEPIYPVRPGSNSLRPADIKRWGIERFFAERAAAGPFQIPPMHFTEEENRRMDELLREEKEAEANGL